jgi:hypothetical protein
MTSEQLFKWLSVTCTVNAPCCVSIFTSGLQWCRCKYLYGAFDSSLYCGSEKWLHGYSIQRGEDSFWVSLGLVQAKRFEHPVRCIRDIAGRPVEKRLLKDAGRRRDIWLRSKLQPEGSESSRAVASANRSAASGQASHPSPCHLGSWCGVFGHECRRGSLGIAPPDWNIRALR